ncbi:hypothetical protein ABT255_57600 [Streptomyces mirabilis]|uniref:hypothetical protein n=1 Tax=Streptomyces mirabilis TaxID=68239 RepID=UPI00332225BA
MSSRIEWQWRDRPSGPPYRQLVEVYDEPITVPATADEDAAEAAFKVLGAHCASCVTCGTVNDDGWANASCDEAEALYREWRRAGRIPSTEGSAAA